MFYNSILVLLAAVGLYKVHRVLETLPPTISWFRCPIKCKILYFKG